MSLEKELMQYKRNVLNKVFNEYITENILEYYQVDESDFCNSVINITFHYPAKMDVEYLQYYFGNDVEAFFGKMGHRMDLPFLKTTKLTEFKTLSKVKLSSKWDKKGYLENEKYKIDVEGKLLEGRKKEIRTVITIQKINKDKDRIITSEYLNRRFK